VALLLRFRDDACLVIGLLLLLGLSNLLFDLEFAMGFSEFLPLGLGPVFEI
jgi:hypothetical protein